MKLIKKIGLLCCMLYASVLPAQVLYQQRHVEVALRMVGHQLLLSSGDTEGKVLPVAYQHPFYTLSFENDFAFEPDSLIDITRRAFTQANILVDYIVEVLPCGSDEVTYSFEVSQDSGKNLLPCKGRKQAKSCYQIRLTLDPNHSDGETVLMGTDEQPTNGLQYLFFCLVIVSAIVGLMYLRRQTMSSEYLQLGAFACDPKKGILIHEGQELVLTGKETDLLLLLFTANQEIVDKETILQEVWGDEGAYVGRTLDVFVSKLRKKLELDPNVQILNQRGVGYKLVY